eukprot:scaffold88028_cov53-Phaeocystis_antarctica.AAC.1
MGEVDGPFRAQIQKHQIVLKENTRTSKGSERTEDSANKRVEDIVHADAKANGSGWVASSLHAVQQIDHAPVLHQHALRLARAARRVDHVRQVVRPHARRCRNRAQAHSHCCCRRRLRHAPCVVQLEHHAAEPPRVLRCVRRLRDQPAARRVLHHELPTRERPLRVERQVRAAREQHAVHAHHLLERAVQLQRHHAVGRHAARHQPRRHPRRARVQLGVAHRVAAPFERHRVGRARRLRRHQLVHAQLSREGRRRLVEAAQHERRLGRRQHRQGPRVGVVRRARQRLRQRRQPRRQPLYALAREEVAVVLDRALDAARRADGRRQRQLHLGHAAAVAVTAVAAVVACTGLTARVPAGGLHLHLRPEAAAGFRAAAPAPVLLPREHRLEDG